MAKTRPLHHYTEHTRDFTMIPSTPEPKGNTTSHVPRKENRAEELRHARKMIDNLQARSSAGASQQDLQEFTKILSTVVDVLQRLEMHDNCDDSGTAATLPETVVSTTTEDSASCHAVDDDGYEVRQSLHEEPRSIRKHTRKQVEQRHDSFDDDILDETDFSQGLAGYEDGFYPEVCDDTSFIDPFAGPTVSVLGSGTPSTKRTKATSSVSEESQCFYCAMHGHKGGCSGTRFCC